MDTATTSQRELLARAARHTLTDDEVLALADCEDTAAMATVASALRDEGFGATVTYSRKLFLPLTQLCRDVCHYCTFAKTPKKLGAAYMTVEQVLEQVREGERLGCKEALFTLGERPERRYRAAREALEQMGFTSTLEYLAHVAGRVLAETSVLPHINAGCMTDEEIALLRPVSASMGIMLETASDRLGEKGMPHYGSPDKVPARRLETIDRAGAAAVPFTSGILIGIGETRRERVESLLALRQLQQRHGHLQEIIIQNFRAKPGTQMAESPEPDLQELVWTIAIARLIFGARMSLQAPPNLSPGVLPQLIAAGINDWGGVSPMTPDYVNPEAPWPEVERLARETAQCGKFLHQRLTVYPRYVRDSATWLAPEVRSRVLAHCDGEGMPREDSWLTGSGRGLPNRDREWLERAGQLSAPLNISPAIATVLDRASSVQGANKLSVADIEVLFSARNDDFAAVCRAADQLRQQRCGETVSYVVNRNINYTNVCYFKCQFCAFSKGKLSENLRGRPYDLSAEEISRRACEAWERGASELCLQGGIHPEYTGQTYLDIVHTLRTATPGAHIHAFSPLEVWQGAQTLGVTLAEFLQRLKAAGLDSMPGTAAEILDDTVRAELCPDKINTAQWLEVMEASHRVGLRTTATIMFGHIDNYQSWARHLVAIRDLQRRTGGFTEFVPLPFVASESPIYLKGRARRGPTLREAVLMHAVARLVFHGTIDNIQASWVKMGVEGVQACLHAGANDVGGTLMNETITRAAGAQHGQEMSPQAFEQLITAAGRRPRPRNTLYGDADPAQLRRARQARPLQPPENTPASRYEREKLVTDIIATA